MRKPSRTLANTTAVLVLAVAMPAAAAPVAPSTAAHLPIPRIFHAILRSAPDPTSPIFPATARSGPDPVCDDARQPTRGPMLLDWWRQWWAAATSQRGARQSDPERPARKPFYLRSPMLSGFFGWREPSGCDDGRRGPRQTSAPHTPAALRGSLETDSAEVSPVPHQG